MKLSDLRLWKKGLIIGLLIGILASSACSLVAKSNPSQYLGPTVTFFYLPVYPITVLFLFGLFYPVLLIIGESHIEILTFWFFIVSVFSWAVGGVIYAYIFSYTRKLIRKFI